MHAEQLDELVREPDATPTGAGLGFRRLVAQRDPVRAVTAELAPTRPVAAGFPAGSSAAAADEKSSGVEVHVVPTEPECFALPKSERERDGPTGPVPSFQRSLVNRPGTGRRRWSIRWKPALSAFDIAFDGRLSAGRK